MTEPGEAEVGDLEPEILLPANIGILGAAIWPVYIGVAYGHPGNGVIALREPWGDPFYQRGQIWWDRPGIGRARIYIPKGVWTHFCFFHGCQQDSLMGSAQMEHPVVYDSPTYLDVDPIRNEDVLGEV